MNDLLLTLFSKYSTLLKHRFSEDFLEIVHTDDYMPMPINSSEEPRNESFFLEQGQEGKMRACGTRRAARAPRN